MRSLKFDNLMILGIVLLAAVVAFSTAGRAYQELPGKGRQVIQGRCTWDTGYFQETLVRRALRDLGYEVPQPRMLENQLFYVGVAQGDVDFWANSWFPNQLNQVPDNFWEKADAYGYIVKNGGLQGYMVDKKSQEKFNMTSLEDFKREEVKKAFDKNGDGKADLFGAPSGWAVNKVMKHHLEIYGLEDHINLLQAGYSALFADVLGNYKSGEAVLFYTWTPNWTVSELEPGKDVMWINVPRIDPLPVYAEYADRMVAEDIEGAVTDPIKLGFLINDIRIVANKKFVRQNPAARKLFEVFKLSVADISRQNAKMHEGEDSQEEINRHVEEWIEAHQATYNDWLEQARAAAP